MPGPRPSLFTRLVRRALLALYRTRGLSVSGEVPPVRRCVIIGAPHTSNWDFLCFLGITDALGIRPSFMGKASLFRWPLGRFMREMGGVPVDRTASHNYVEAMAAEFAARDHFMLVIAPEGTRKGVRRWRTGFYHIAMAAQVPLVCGFIDYPRRRGGFGPAIMPSGDYAADMAKVAEFYAGISTHNPALAITGIESILGRDTLLS